MQRSVKKIRPKANKLLSFSANWKRANRKLNKQLGEQIELLIAKETFPKAIALFLEIPMFKRVLKNLKKGSLWKDVYVFTEEDHHPPKEIQKVQNVTSAFQAVCSISHYPNYPDNTLAKAKLLTSNLRDYLFLAYKVRSFRGRAADALKKHLAIMAKQFIHELHKELKKDKELFAALQQSKELKEIKKITGTNILLEEIALTYEVSAYLNACMEESDTATTTCRKILNQMHKQVDIVFDAVIKNAPFFLPYSIKKAVYEVIQDCHTSTELYDRLVYLFDDGRYDIIETKQASHMQNVMEASIPLHILELSLDKIAYHKDLPEKFRTYFDGYYSVVKGVLENIDCFNSQAGYFLTGFYETQISYLLELLNNPPVRIEEVDTSLVEEILVPFLEKYARVKPELLQIDIKRAFTNEYIKELSVADAKCYIKNTFSLIVPESNEDIFISLEKDCKDILVELLNIYKSINKESYTAHLLKEKIKNLYLIDVPSLQLGWYLFGEILSILFILCSYQEKEVKDTVQQFLVDLYQYPIFTILLNSKRSSLPKIFIKLQMISD